MPQHSAQAYLWRMTGIGASHRERKLQKVTCNLCGNEVARQHLSKHQETGRCKSKRKDYQAAQQAAGVDLTPAAVPEPVPPELPPAEYRVSMDGEHTTPCPVNGCPAKPIRRNAMRVHFQAKHPRDTIVIEEEGRFPRCTKCGIFSRAVGTAHQKTQYCIKATKVKSLRKAEELNRRIVEETVFTVQGIPIETVSEFQYLGRIVTNNDDDSAAVNRNLTRARQKWGRIGKVLIRTGAAPKTMASFYKAIVQSVLLFGSETWVLSQLMERKLQSFHHRCARFITGQHIRKNNDDTWTCPSSEGVLRDAGMWTIQQYIGRRRSTVMRYASDRNIYKRCVASKPLASCNKQLVWWLPDETV